MFPISLEPLNNQERHNLILKTYVLTKQSSSKVKRDVDVIRENHQFLWEDENAPEDSWEVRLAKRYYDKLFKEYCIADLSRYKENKIAMRWRTEAEVVSGKGQFQCGSRRCEEREQLRTWEVNFSYQEHNVKKNALVKLRLCSDHSAQLNYRSRKREIKRLKRTEAEKSKESRKYSKRYSKESSEIGVECNQFVQNCKETEAPSKDETSNIFNTLQSDPVQVEPDVWCKKAEVDDQTSRETDFERYLENLFL